MIRRLLLTLALVASATPAFAAPQTLLLSPLNTLAQTHSRAVMISFTGTYRQLSGVLDYDPQAGTCHFDARFVVRSLTSPNAMIRNRTMSKSFLDPQDFPEIRYVGDCRGNSLAGSLTLHGQTHPFVMTLRYQGPPAQPYAVHAEGIVQRAEWGLTGLHLLVSQQIRITNDISLNGQPPTSPPP